MNEWDSWVGQTTASTVTLDVEQANLMAAMLDRAPEFSAGDALPPGWHWLYLHDTVRASQLGLDGHPALGVTMPPVPLERRMWASGSLSFNGTLRLGDEVSWTRTIADITSKEGRSGSLYFVTVLHTVDVGKDRRVDEQQNIVYRELVQQTGRTAVSTEPTAPSAPDDATISRRWSLDNAALFRYSALTFNSHRIHYDADYARDIEGYPNVVIHGPLLASLLMDLARESGGPLATFSYRARSPLFLPDEFTTHGRRSSTDAALWAASADGRLAMDATATYQETN